MIPVQVWLGWFGICEDVKGVRDAKDVKDDAPSSNGEDPTFSA